jgi:hypothetical protein
MAESSTEPTKPLLFGLPDPRHDMTYVEFMDFMRESVRMPIEDNMLKQILQHPKGRKCFVVMQNANMAGSFLRVLSYTSKPRVWREWVGGWKNFPIDAIASGTNPASLPEVVHDAVYHLADTPFRASRITEDGYHYCFYRVEQDVASP